MIKNILFKARSSFSAITILFTIVSCSSTPNSITMSPNQNQCVQSDMYSSSVTPPTIIEANPQTAPYCMSVTINNNNSGLNANNIQITGNGLVMTYSVGTTTYISQMYDPVAAGIGISGANQVLGNVEVFDPYNCLTTTGANVVTLNAGGGACTYYLQILNESNPVGVYGTNLSYNYTNGNQNYSVGANINQRVNLYAGGTSGLFINNDGSWINSSSLPVPISIPTAVTGLARDIFGNIYISTAQTVYQFDGDSTNQVGNTIPDAQINGITTDLVGSVYIATNEGIFKYNFNESSPSWLPFNDLSVPGNIGPTTNIISIKSYENVESTNVIYATTESEAYICNNQNDLNGNLGCHWALLTTGNQPTTFFKNALAVDSFNNLYTANGTSVNWYSPSSGWQNISYFESAITSGDLSSIFWTQFNNSQYLYVGENNAINLNESSVYFCNPSPINCQPLISQSGNPITGDVFAVAADGANNLNAVGNGLNSLDFLPATNVFGAFLNFPESNTSTATTWTAIDNGSSPVISGGALTVLKISSMLTSY